jgi:hypothetical protein
MYFFKIQQLLSEALTRMSKTKVTQPATRLLTLGTFIESHYDVDAGKCQTNTLAR